MEEENKATYRRFLDEVIVRGNSAVLDDYLPPGYIDHSSFIPSGDRESRRQGLAQLHAAFSDVQAVIDDLIAAGDKVVSRYSFKAKHSGEFLGVPPSGKEVSSSAIEIVRFAGGKMVERWEEWDSLGFMQRLGLVRAVDSAGQ